ncbi:GrpB family protein [Halomonas sp. LR3S48]|uniref:GrpB family protein n=1 Tax=Halomonas sp. LR3S48 TaxID=2982694 RepID=UPI0021E3D7DD|nr:GrpB family protein [Halomonas sp. LR3S48]UYG05508.1 GrpB family protein [Halomonas sp. LR3S48]
MNMNHIVVVPYEESWARRFDEERCLIEEAVAGLHNRVHHIGSTSVEGLQAKPIIDILLEVADLQELDGRSRCFEAIGYECLGEFGLPGRRYYRKGGISRTHQIHAFEWGSLDAQRHLAFRDYLRAHPVVAREYGELKQRVAKVCRHDITRYSEGKADFVKLHEQRALAWREQMHP